MNYYPHHIGDFNNSTRHLTRVERSLYRDLIELYYDTEQPLISDIPKLSRKIMAHSDEEKEALSAVLDEYFTLFEGSYTHDRCDLEIDKYRSNTSAKARAGKASAEARRIKKESKKEHKPTRVEQPLNTCGTNQEPITSNQEPIKPLVPVKPSPAKKYKYSDWDMDFSKQAFTLITKDLPNAKQPNYESWANDCRKMRELDNRPKEEMIKLWQWIRQDSFWHSNILSMSKFKSKYDQLLLKSGVSGNGQAKTTGSDNQQGIIGRLKNKPPTIRGYEA